MFRFEELQASGRTRGKRKRLMLAILVLAVSLLLSGDARANTQLLSPSGTDDIPRISIQDIRMHNTSMGRHV